jgi:hypothetical protein
MNYNHYILILIFLVIILDITYDYFFKKIKVLPERKKKILPEKWGSRLFLYIIYLFPLITTVFSPVKKEFNIFDSIKEYMSFYATALTITFTIYSFIESQKEREDERNKIEKQREEERIEREEQKERERVERENKNFELREKELEDKKDYYRPIFVVETDQYDDSKKQVKLLMKDDSLYLERVRFYCKQTNKNLFNCQFKSGDIIGTCEGGSFYITANTLIGETILFGYLDDEIKIYKYLKDNGNPAKPYKEDLIPYYKKNEIDNVWGTYNKITDEYDSLDSAFFYSTGEIRFFLSFSKGRSFSAGLKQKTATNFFRCIFLDMNQMRYFYEDTNYIRYKILREFIDVFNENIDYVYIDIDKIDKDEFRMFSHSLVSIKIPKELESKIINLNFNINSFDMLEFLQIMGEYMDFIEEDLSEEILTDILMVFDRVFDAVELDSAMDVHLPKYKSYILELTFEKPSTFTFSDKVRLF